MNALLLSPQSLSVFWAMPRTCKLSGARALIQPLGLITVAGMLPPEWDIRLVDLATGRVTEEDWQWADVVMVSGMIAQSASLLSLIRQAKQRGKPVVAGGPYPTSVPNEPLDAGCDFLVLGEGENSIPLFLAALGRGERGGIFEVEVKPDLTGSPIPRFDLLRLDDYASIAIQTARGCPYECEFCDIENLYGRVPRFKTPEQVLAELEVLYRLGWRAEVFISDDNFVGNKAHARALLEKLIPWMKNRGEPFSFWTQASVNLGQDRELIDLMTEANFSTVFVGVESPDEDVLAFNRKYQNIRNPLMESLDIMNRNGLTAMASFVMGFDNERDGIGERIATFVEKSSIPAVLINTLCALPNTRLWSRLEKEGRIVASANTCDGTGGKLNYVPTRPEAEILKEYGAVCDYLYEPTRYLSRAYRYHLAMRPTRSALAGKKGTARPRKPSSAKPSLRRSFWNIAGFFRLVWWQGIRPPYRLQFWRQLIGMWNGNPSRMVRYLKTCALGENLFDLRREILKKLGHID